MLSRPIIFKYGLSLGKYLDFQPKKFKYRFEMGKAFRNIVLVITAVLYLNICSALLISSIVFHPLQSSVKITSLKKGTATLPPDNLNFQRRHVTHLFKISELVAVNSNAATTERRNSSFEIFSAQLISLYNSSDFSTSKERAPPAA